VGIWCCRCEKCCCTLTSEPQLRCLLWQDVVEYYKVQVCAWREFVC
jgi:hypothetical protein